jgi:hypothetical protein
MIRRIIIYLTLIYTCPFLVSGQETVIGLQSNTMVAGRVKRSLEQRSSSDTISLPFFDDFSNQSVAPDTKKWEDDYVFINNTYSDKQITSGIATFDALDDKGMIYTTATVSGFEADHLTSKPINLNYNASDNLYFSFFYQAGGLSDAPELRDSLTLQFRAPGEEFWRSVWKAAGSNDKRFRPVIIKIDKDIYLNKGFRFRFVNYTSLSSNTDNPSLMGNCDIWNIDYVKLDKNRNSGDTIFHDVAFSLPVRSILKNHEAMPWKQFRQIELQEMGSSIPIHYRNNDTITRNVTRSFEIWDVYKNTLSESFSAGAANIAPQTSTDYDASLVYTFNTTGTDSAMFRITCSLKTDEFDPKQNDTMVYYQVFNDYFAFDDGSSEGGYGVTGQGSRNAMVAHKFRSYIPDTLTGIRICFNDSYSEANKRAFDLMVWKDNNGIPGDILYTKEEVIAEQGNMINGFYEYTFTDGVPVDGIFYVGWKQRSEAFLNAGFDINTLPGNNQFYWINGNWNQTQMKGSLMIRPVTGSIADIITSADDITVNKNASTIIWPNPAHEYFKINAEGQPVAEAMKIKIIDMMGRELMNVEYNERIDISGLKEGPYIVVITVNGRTTGYTRLVKLK